MLPRVLFILYLIWSIRTIDKICMWCWVFSQIIKKKKKSQEKARGGSYREPVPKGDQRKVCLCSREPGRPQQLLYSKITFHSLGSRVNERIGFTEQLQCLGSCLFGIKFLLIWCFIWFKPKSDFWKNKSVNWKLVLHPDLLCFVVWLVDLVWFCLFVFTLFF